jgi:hypothetical protein
MARKIKNGTSGLNINVEFQALPDEIVAELVNRVVNGPRGTRFERGIKVLESHGFDPRNFCITWVVKNGLAGK